MIKNEKQYRITHTKLSEIQREMRDIKAANEVDLPAEEQLIMASLEAMKRQMKEEIAAYDLLKKKVIH